MIDIGTVAVDDDGKVSGSGLSLELYEALATGEADRTVHDELPANDPRRERWADAVRAGERDRLRLIAAKAGALAVVLARHVGGTSG